MFPLADLFAYLREFNLLSVVVRLLAAMLFGGMLGIDRAKKGRAAGFRTYMFVCLGAALAMLLSQYESAMLAGRWADAAGEVGIRTDVSRFGAQVINGIGFLGAGTIIVTGRHKVKGLTTAAGLWASACMGLAIGIGFYEAAVAACLLILFVNSALHRMDSYVVAKSKVVELYVEFGTVEDISGFIGRMRDKDIRVSELEVTKNTNSVDSSVAATMLLRSTVKRDRVEILAVASDVKGVKFVEAI